MERLRYRADPKPGCAFGGCANLVHTKRQRYCRAHLMQLWRAGGDEAALRPLRMRPQRVADDGARVRCSRCGAWKPPNAFGPDRSRGGAARYCRACRAELQRKWNADHPEAIRRTVLKRKGLTPERYDTMLVAQGGGCAICGGTNRNGRMLAVDHDHATGEVRGLLCSDCNVVLGHVQDNPDLLRRAAEYLERALAPAAPLA